MQKIYVFILLSLGIAVHDAYPANPLFDILNERITITQQTPAGDDDNGDWEVQTDDDDSRAGEEATGSSVLELQRAAEYLIERDHTLFSKEEDFSAFFTRKKITDPRIKQIVSNFIVNFKTNLIRNWNACIAQLDQNPWSILQHPDDPTHPYSKLPEFSKNKMLEEQQRRRAATPRPTPVQVSAPAPIPDGPQRNILDRIRDLENILRQPNSETQPEPTPEPDETSWAETENWIIGQIQNGIPLSQINADYCAAYEQYLLGPDGVLPQTIKTNVAAQELAEALRRRSIPTPRPAPTPTPELAPLPTAADRALLVEHLGNIEAGLFLPDELRADIHPRLHPEWDRLVVQLRQRLQAQATEHVGNIEGGLPLSYIEPEINANLYLRQIMIEALNGAGIHHNFRP